MMLFLILLLYKILLINDLSQTILTLFKRICTSFMYQFYADYWRRQAEWAGPGIYCHSGLARLSSRTNE